MHRLHAHETAAGVLTLLLALEGRPVQDPAPTAEVAERIERPPIWSHAGRPTAAARAAIELIATAGSHGLDPKDYDISSLRDALREASAESGGDAARLAVLEARLTAAVSSFLIDLHQGRAPSAGARPHADLTPAMAAERVRAAVESGTFDALAADVEPGFAQYRHLKAALARLPPGDGGPEADSMRRRIGRALERLRWLPHAPAGPLIVANIPAFRLLAFRSGRDDEPALRMPIVVGRAGRRRTPVFVGAISQVVFHPPWYPPSSIVRNEVLPALERDGGLQRTPFDVVTSSGVRRPTPADLEAVRAGRLRLRQPPGRDNPLGRVKFVFPNEHGVYMHDTPSRALFARTRRDFSHGCIRVEDAPALAAFVLQDDPRLDADAVTAALEGTRTITVPVDPPVPVYIAYTTTIAHSDGTVETFDDVYGLDAAAERAPSGGRDRPGRRP